MVPRTINGTGYHRLALRPNGGIGAMTPNNRRLRTSEPAIGSSEAPSRSFIGIRDISDAGTRTPSRVQECAEGSDL